MTSPAQAEANRRNAQASTGPRSAAGKARAAADPAIIIWPWHSLSGQRVPGFGGLSRDLTGWV
jgi:hypothetical protein